MAYCKNCGSILQSNANFCHVCGTKVDVSDVFDAPEENMDASSDSNPNQKNESNTQNDGNAYQNQNNGYQNGNPFRSYYDAFQSQEMYTNAAPEAPSKRAFVPGLISMIGSLVVSLEAGFNLLYTKAMADFEYEKSLYTYDEYLTAVKEGYITSGVYFIMAAILGIVLGLIGLKVAKRVKSKKGLIFSIIGLSVAGCALIGGIVLFVLYANINMA